MAVRKISPISVFTIFLTLLLLSSRIYCNESEDEDCEDEEGGNGIGINIELGNLLGGWPAKGSGSNPGKGPGSNPGKGSGSVIEIDLGLDLLGLVSNLSKSLESIPGLDDATKQLGGLLNPDYLKGVLKYGGGLVEMLLLPIIKTLLDTVEKLKDPASLDPKSLLENLTKGTLGPVGDTLNELGAELSSELTAGESEIFNNLPPQFAPLQAPVEDLLGSIDQLTSTVTDVVQGASTLDVGGVVKSLGKIGGAVKGLTSTVMSLGSDLNINVG